MTAASRNGIGTAMPLAKWRIATSSDGSGAKLAIALASAMPRNAWLAPYCASKRWLSASGSRSRFSACDRARGALSACSGPPPRIQISTLLGAVAAGTAAGLAAWARTEKQVATSAEGHDAMGVVMRQIQSNLRARRETLRACDLVRAIIARPRRRPATSAVSWRRSAEAAVQSGRSRARHR